MLKENNYRILVDNLRSELQLLQKNIEIKDILDNEFRVLDYFGHIFSKESIPMLNKEDFKSFLSFKGNRHWTGLNRHPKIYADMEKLRNELAYLLDEEEPIEDRINQIIENELHHVSGMGKATVTAVLLVAFPKRYGIWNKVSENALIKVNLLSNSDLRHMNTGQKYKTINEILLRLASDLNMSLWTLDAIWWLPSFCV